MKLIVTENITDIQHCDYCTGQTESKTRKIQDAVCFFPPQVAKGYFEKTPKHNFKCKLKTTNNVLQKELKCDTSAKLLYQPCIIPDHLIKTIGEIK
jgi:hypothetical protein